MPRRPQRVCAHPGCSALTDRGRCERHQVEERRRHDRQRGSAASRGYGRTWQRLRAMILARDPVCACRGLEGCDHTPGNCLTPSTDVDHITPRRRGGSDSEGNLQGLCHACHSRKTAAEDGRWG